MDPKSFRDMQVQTRGEFGGLGIEVTMEDGLIKVVAPIDDTPLRLQAVLLRQDRVFGDILLKKHAMFDTVMAEGAMAARDDWK